MANVSTKKSIIDLTTSFHSTTGDVPPVLIGPTTTIVGDRLFLFGGRLKASRQIFNHLYVLSLTNYSWSLVVARNDAPTPRYFHSANRYGNKIVFYGGMTIDKDGSNDQTVLGDVFILNVNDESLFWEYPKVSPSEYGLPQPRYAHNATVANDQLVIFGGQDITNSYIAEMNVLDLKQRLWFSPIPTMSHYGAYRSATMAVTPSPRTPLLVADDFTGHFVVDEPGRRPRKARSNIYIYSNYNFDNLRREMDVISVTRKGDIAKKSSCSPALVGERLPPPLRFPKVFACGKHMVLSGTLLTNTAEQFQLWSFDISLMVWTKLETETLLAKGSWLRGELYEDRNQFLVFGNEQGSMREDYKDRVADFRSCYSIDIEAFGIYRAPITTHDLVMQGLGLAFLNNSALTDLTIVSTDNESVRVNSTILLQRWPSISDVLRPLRSLPADNLSSNETFKLSFPGTALVLKAFLHFIYTDHISTAQQHRPDILSHLLLLSDLLGIKRLKELTIYALHQKLNKSTASLIYDTAALARASSLQIRALRILFDANLIEHDQNHAPKARRPPSLVKPNTVHITPRVTARRRQLPPITIHNHASHPLSPLSPHFHMKDIVEQERPLTQRTQLSQPESQPESQPKLEPIPQPRRTGTPLRAPTEGPRSYLREIIAQAVAETETEAEAERYSIKGLHINPTRSHLQDIIDQTRQILPSNLTPTSSLTTPPNTPPATSIIGGSRAKNFPFWQKKRQPMSPGTSPIETRSTWIQRTTKF